MRTYCLMDKIKEKHYYFYFLNTVAIVLRKEMTARFQMGKNNLWRSHSYKSRLIRWNSKAVILKDLVFY